MTTSCSYNHKNCLELAEFWFDGMTYNDWLDVVIIFAPAWASSVLLVVVEMVPSPVLEAAFNVATQKSSVRTYWSRILNQPYWGETEEELGRQQYWNWGYHVGTRCFLLMFLSRASASIAKVQLECWEQAIMTWRMCRELCRLAYQDYIVRAS